MQISPIKKVLVIGGGLAGVEASYFLAQKGIKVVLLENKTIQKNPAQKLSTLAELVCTNSLKSMIPDSAHGILKTEMKAFGSLVLTAAYEAQVPAGDALAVDREKFSNYITDKISNHPHIQYVEIEATDPNKHLQEFECDFAIIASGPLTTDPLNNWIKSQVSADDYYFYDAIAPVVDADSLDYSKLYFKDRKKEASESADYLNAPMNKEEYYTFIEALKTAEKVPAKDFEDYKFFEACLPVDLMAERGADTARFSCMKPIGLKLPSGEEPFAVVQLRKENLLGSAFNLVGFQTRLTYKEQNRVFKMIPGFENASFIHLGSVHRNSFLNAKKLLNHDLSLKNNSQIHFAGQITGVEGYTESASMGLYVAYQVYLKLNGQSTIQFPVETGMGALVNYIMTNERPAPSNINFGLFPTISLNKEQRKNKSRKMVKKSLIAERANQVFHQFARDHKVISC